jgi:hypothetical protein
MPSRHLGARVTSNYRNTVCLDNHGSISNLFILQGGVIQ